MKRVIVLRMNGLCGLMRRFKMNRFKKEIRKKGIKLASDYPWLPYDTGNMTVDMVNVNTEKVTVIVYYTSIVMRYVMRNDGALIVDSL